MDRLQNVSRRQRLPVLCEALMRCEMRIRVSNTAAAAAAAAAAVTAVNALRSFSVQSRHVADHGDDEDREVHYGHVRCDCFSS